MKTQLSDEEKLARIGLTYLLMAIITYGVAWNRSEAKDDDVKTGVAFASSMFWPFYWSVQATKFLKPPQPQPLEK